MAQKYLVSIILAATTFAVFMSANVWACATCFGDPNSATSSALRGAVLILIVLTFSIFGAIGYGAWRLMRRSQLLKDQGVEL